ncbi:MAG: hypothetical protein DRQ42_01585 [Gammaproteobacteria bacterium]|nr:MAG: hypothetical protein DRQ42_01585 [Gammaproteobacteria bacterium]
MVNVANDDIVLEAVYKRALAGENGKKIKEDLGFYAYRMSHTPGDSLTTAFKDGERALAIRILQLSGELK